MIAHRLLEDARAAGCSIEVEGGALVIESDRDPPVELIATLRRHKVELIAALVPRDQTDADRWREFFQERAALREFDGRHCRSDAELLAWSELQARWNMERGERVSSGLCAGCRRPIGLAATLDLIDGNCVHMAEDNACLVRHGERWRTAATYALMALGLRPPAVIAEQRLRNVWGARRAMPVKGTRVTREAQPAREPG
jgi:hypothetical protein